MYKRSDICVVLTVFSIGVGVLPVCSSCKSDSKEVELVEGKCGLEGRMVECNADIQCWNKGLGEACLMDGTCSRTEDWPCAGVPPGAMCGEGMVCGEDVDCTSPCWIHEDCGPNGVCYCFSQADPLFVPNVPGWCRYP